jgi:hypothetical protein
MANGVNMFMSRSLWWVLGHLILAVAWSAMELAWNQANANRILILSIDAASNRMDRPKVSNLIPSFESRN